MIIYGTRSQHLKSSQPPSMVCPHCGQTGTTVLSVYSKYAHIFWIPIFPVGRTAYSQCAHCKQVLEQNKMSPELQRESNNLKAQTRTPIWQFAGVVLIAALVGFSMYASGQAAKDRQEYIANPMTGDIYNIKTEDKNYTTFKIVSVTADSVFVSPNKYETDKSTGIYKINKAENYLDESYGISRSTLKQMLQDDTIYGIDRN